MQLPCNIDVRQSRTNHKLNILFPFQTESEKAELVERRREAEVERAAAREETARVQQEMMNLLAEKQALESSHSLLKNLCQKLEAELSLLQKENAQALEQHSQVRNPQPFTHFSLHLPSSHHLGDLTLLIAFIRFTQLIVTLKCIGDINTSAMVFSFKWDMENNFCVL